MKNDLFLPVLNLSSSLALAALAAVTLPRFYFAVGGLLEKKEKRRWIGKRANPQANVGLQETAAMVSRGKGGDIALAKSSRNGGGGGTRGGTSDLTLSGGFPPARATESVAIAGGGRRGRRNRRVFSELTRGSGEAKWRGEVARWVGELNRRWTRGGGLLSAVRGLTDAWVPRTGAHM